MHLENQRRPDLGNGYYMNPILGGDYPDPSVLRVGDDYYMTHSSFNYAPGLLIWHARDLVNWQPLTYALPQYDGDVWAPELILHDGTFYIYYKTSGSNHVVTSTRIEGPWSKPVDLKLGYIDPGHLATSDGRRFLYLSDGRVTEYHATVYQHKANCSMYIMAGRFRTSGVSKASASKAPKCLPKTASTT
jgi:beta-xylosidase